MSRETFSNGDASKAEVLPVDAHNWPAEVIRLHREITELQRMVKERQERIGEIMRELGAGSDD